MYKAQLGNDTNLGWYVSEPMTLDGIRQWARDMLTAQPAYVGSTLHIFRCDGKAGSKTIVAAL